MVYQWSWADVQGTSPPPPPRIIHGGQLRPQGRFSRFQGTSSHADRSQAALPSNHPAIVEERTLFPSSVVDAAAAPRVLVSGHNSAKLGRIVTKGPWRGLPIYHLTLEERATCPASCGLWLECFGNAMPFSRRIEAGPALVPTLWRELRALASRHEPGFVVRLHVLGDFFSVDYVASWCTMMALLPRLRVFGYTAWPQNSEIGRQLSALRAAFPGRWMICSSVQPETPTGLGQATTIWRAPEAAVVPEGIVCPAQTHRTDTCGTCGLCWHPAAWDKRIVFVGHGRRSGGRPRPKVAA